MDAPQRALGGTIDALLRLLSSMIDSSAGSPPAGSSGHLPRRQT